MKEKQEHLNLLIIGNERTEPWKKAVGLARTDELVPLVEGVLNDKWGRCRGLPAEAMTPPRW